MMPNSDQIGGVVRALFALFAGWALAHGITADQWGVIAAGVSIVIGVAVSSLFSNSTAHQINVVAESPDVHAVVLKDPGTAMANPNPKVIPVGGNVP